MTNGTLMKVKSIAECSPWSILQFFWPTLRDNWYKKLILVFLRAAFLHRLTVHCSNIVVPKQCRYCYELDFPILTLIIRLPVLTTNYLINIHNKIPCKRLILLEHCVKCSCNEHVIYSGFPYMYAHSWRNTILSPNSKS